MNANGKRKLKRLRKGHPVVTLDTYPEMDRDVVIKSITGVDGGEDRVTLQCPVCDFGSSHIGRVFTRLGEDDYETRVYEGTKTFEQGGYKRRSAVVIELYGECCHRWNLVIQQHKGNNYVEIEVVSSDEGDGEGYPDGWQWG